MNVLVFSAWEDAARVAAAAARKGVAGRPVSRRERAVRRAAPRRRRAADMGAYAYCTYFLPAWSAAAAVLCV
jgi:hypothetical protein